MTKMVPVKKLSKKEHENLLRMQEEARVGKPLVPPEKMTPKEVRKAVRENSRTLEEITSALHKARTKACRDFEYRTRQIQKACPHQNLIDTGYVVIEHHEGMERPLSRSYRCKDCGKMVKKKNG